MMVKNNLGIATCHEEELCLRPLEPEISNGSVLIWKTAQVFSPAVIKFLLFVAMVGKAVSSVMISGDIFSFSPFITTHFARTLHIFLTAWGFLYMLFHVGLHTHVVLERLGKKQVLLFLATPIIGFSLWC